MYWVAIDAPRGSITLYSVEENRVDDSVARDIDLIIFEAELTTEVEAPRVKIENNPNYTFPRFRPEPGGQGSRVGDTDYG